MRDIKLLLIIIAGLLLMFVTSLLLDIEIIQALLIRKALVYLLILIEFIFFYQLVKLIIHKRDNVT